MTEPEALLSEFRNPGNRYRPMPFWFLNHELREPELRRQLASMHEQGVGGVVLHARHGLMTPFMSDQWLDMIGVCVDECKSRGMEAWLYDEDNWPSGTFGGKLTREHPEFRMRYLRVEELDTKGLISLTPPEGNTFLAAFAVRPDAMRPRVVRASGDPSGSAPSSPQDVIDLTDAVSKDRLEWRAPDEHWRVVLFWECEVGAGVTFNNGYYLDTMNPEACQAFVDLAYEPYARRFHAELGRTIRGIFTDEPGLMIHDGFFGSAPVRTRVDDLNGTLPGVVLPWTRDCLARFGERKKYDLRPLLPALLYEVGGDWAQVRLDFYDCLTDFYLDAYHQRMSRWCASHGIEYIGHTLEEPLWGQIRSQGNQIKVLEQFHRPGLDYLGSGIGTRENPHRILSVKCASSVAHVQGKPRVLCEAFGGSGHGHSLAARKLDASFMAVLGVNMFLPHAFYYSLEGYRKTDWPPTEFFHAPHWPYYRAFADYLARLSLVQASGYHAASLAILSPIRSGQIHIFQGGRCERNLDEDRIYAHLSDRLLRLHHDYDYLDDSQLAMAGVTVSRLSFPQSRESYRTILLPLCQVISVSAAEKLLSFYESGGHVIAFGCVPDRADQTGHHEKVRAAMAGTFGEAPKAGVRKANAAGGVSVFFPEWEGKEYEINKLLVNLDAPDVRCFGLDGGEQEDVYVCHRVLDAAHFYLLVNTQAQSKEVILSVRQTGRVEEWNLENGLVTGLESVSVKAGRTEIEIRLEPLDSRLLAVGYPASDAMRPARLPKASRERKSYSPAWRFSTLGPNVMILDQWQVSLRDYSAARLERQGTVGQTNAYIAQFMVIERPKKASLVFDNLKQWIPHHMGFLLRFRNLEAYLNGRRLPPLSPSTWQDPHYLMADVTEMVQQGRNLLEIRTISCLEPMRSLMDPVYLVGDFSLHDGSIAPPLRSIAGYWTEEGYPHYSGIGVYEADIEVPADFASSEFLELSLTEVRDGCAISVNGNPAQVRPWPPFSVDISGMLVPGVNRLSVKVWNSLANLYGGETRASGLSGPLMLAR